jgi:flagellar biosynthetic protein FliR
MHLEGFVLVLTRTGAMLLTAPLFGNRAIPRQLKIGLTVLVSLLLFPVVDARGIVLPPGLIPWMLLIRA